MATVADQVKPTARASEGGSGLRREVGRTALLFTSVGSVIGSGWLLGAMNAIQIGGPAAIISWGSSACSR
jgi:amino acid transporter